MKQRLAATMLGIAIAIVLPVGSAAGARGSHCAIRLVTTQRHGSVNLATRELIGCYGTFAEAIAAGSDGHIQIPSDMTAAQLTNRELSSSATSASDVLIGTEYNITGYGGSSNSYFAPSTCSATNTWELNYVGDAWNDLFSSGKGFGGCDHNKKFQAADFGGNVLTCTPNCSDYGQGMSNQVSSLRWKP